VRVECDEEVDSNKRSQTDSFSIHLNLIATISASGTQCGFENKKYCVARIREANFIFSWKCEDRPSYELIIQSFPITADLHLILFVARLIIAVFLIATVTNSL
jgi:hypothetical protein